MPTDRTIDGVSMIPAFAGKPVERNTGNTAAGTAVVTVEDNALPVVSTQNATITLEQAQARGALAIPAALPEDVALGEDEVLDDLLDGPLVRPRPGRYPSGIGPGQLVHVTGRTIVQFIGQTGPEPAKAAPPQVGEAVVELADVDGPPMARQLERLKGVEIELAVIGEVVHGEQCARRG